MSERLTSGQVASAANVDRTTVHYWVRTNKLTPVEVVNGIRLFDPTDVEALIAKRAEAAS